MVGGWRGISRTCASQTVMHVASSYGLAPQQNQVTLAGEKYREVEERTNCPIHNTSPYSPHSCVHHVVRSTTTIIAVISGPREKLTKLKELAEKELQAKVKDKEEDLLIQWEVKKSEEPKEGLW